MKRVIDGRAALVLGLFCASLMAGPSLLAQEWSGAQKEVWKNVETYWDLETKQDLEGFLSYFHEDYRGWENGSALPVGKAEIRKFLSHDFQTTKRVVYTIQPVAIQVHGNVAFADYYYTEVVKDAEGREKNRSGRWTDILLKQGDKWVLIGDHGGQTSKD